LILEKSWYFVSEAAELLASEIGISKQAARIRIYRAIDNGKIVAHSFLGVMKIERGYVEHILNGEKKS